MRATARTSAFATGIVAAFVAAALLAIVCGRGARAHGSSPAERALDEMLVHRASAGAPGK